MLTLTPRLRTLLLAGLWLFATLHLGQAYGHGSTEPQHGGVVKIVGEMSFELVNGDNRIELYLLDDGELMDTSNMTARIKIKSETPARYIDLQPAGGNRFSAANVSLADGAKILALVTLANGYSKIGANFTIGEPQSH